jgi:hypothetical protein
MVRRRHLERRRARHLRRAENRHPHRGHDEIAPRVPVGADHVVRQRLAEEQRIRQIERVDVVGRVELVARAPDHDLAADAQIEVRQDLVDVDVGGVGLEAIGIDALVQRVGLDVVDVGVAVPIEVDVADGLDAIADGERQLRLDEVLVARKAVRQKALLRRIGDGRRRRRHLLAGEPEADVARDLSAELHVHVGACPCAPTDHPRDCYYDEPPLRRHHAPNGRGSVCAA